MGCGFWFWLVCGCYGWLGAVCVSSILVCLCWVMYFGDFGFEVGGAFVLCFRGKLWVVLCLVLG